MGLRENLESMLAAGNDTALLRFTLGNEYLKVDDAKAASTHLRCAVEQDPNYSAAWKLLGKALTEEGRDDEAIRAYKQGIEVAETKGDIQAVKEMTVFLKRLLK